jgi:hypothetical protein
MMADLVPILGVIFSVGLPMVGLIVWITLNYRKRRRLMELYHAERMAAIERGMELPPLEIDLIDGRSRRPPRSALLPGLVWFFAGLGLLLALFGGDDYDIPLFFAAIPVGVGIAYLIYYFAEGKSAHAREVAQHDGEHTSGRSS